MNAHRILYAAICIALLFIVQGCRDGASEPELIPDRTACSNCKMLISETQYAGAFKGSFGSEVKPEEEIFDDLGCMMERLSSAEGLTLSKVWVRDFKSDKWIDAANAWFVKSSEVRTPMGHGFLAFSHEADGRGATSENSWIARGLEAFKAHYQQSLPN